MLVELFLIVLTLTVIIAVILSAYYLAIKLVGGFTGALRAAIENGYENTLELFKKPLPKAVETVQISQPETVTEEVSQAAETAPEELSETITFPQKREYDEDLTIPTYVRRGIILGSSSPLKEKKARKKAQGAMGNRPTFA